IKFSPGCQQKVLGSLAAKTIKGVDKLWKKGDWGTRRRSCRRKGGESAARGGRCGPGRGPRSPSGGGWRSGEPNGRVGSGRREVRPPSFRRTFRSRMRFGG